MINQLKLKIKMAALPQAIISFVFAKEYNLHAEIMSTSVIVGMVVALPVTIIYYVKILRNLFDESMEGRVKLREVH
ncbi:hypothetical protein F8388_026513 [Cannabis sativa]|uniref:Uncharacterized protein n=1 Tax=Cannabis sativa TaxID=3483 RepID=A0A7J6FHT5_CANSA|nr:hypothetical protein F8388_019674 [Cannabis sativa]KAF4355012.1 hypothetical protein F8388_026513 [Cannabis sativa]KAF4370256.1 hypothetical protein G4B88_021730 [Cannabis sativa]